jgi:putative holliday junction resolvase
LSTSLPPALYLALDYGLRRIGVACGDTITLSARPLGVVAAHNGEPDWPKLAHWIKEFAPQALIVGLPYNMDDSIGALMPQVQAFAQALGQRFNLTVHLVDERLSSKEAEDRLRQARQAGERTRRVRHGDVDAMAACVLMEQWLNAQSSLKRPHPTTESERPSASSDDA